jgi:anion-transporting  ArsA/GET3 family ATPase
VVELLTDPGRCQVVLVTLPEEMPVNEAIDAAYQLEDKVGISLGPVIVNACYTPAPDLEVTAVKAAAEAGVSLDDTVAAALDAASHFRRTREDLQREQIERLARGLPLPHLRVPFVFAASIGPAELQVLADELAAGIRALPDGREEGT